MTWRYMPSIVLVVWVLLLVAGVPPHLLRIPGLLALAAALAMFAVAEPLNVKNERRSGEDRRRVPRPGRRRTEA